MSRDGPGMLRLQHVPSSGLIRIVCCGLAVLSLLPQIATTRAAPSTAAAVGPTVTMDYLIDPQGRYTLDSLLADSGASFRPGEELSDPGGTRAPVWIRLKLQFPRGTDNQRYQLVSANQLLDEVRIYRPERGGGYNRLVTGNDHPVSSREFDVWYYVFSLDPGVAEQTIYLRVMAPGGVSPLAWLVLPESKVNSDARAFLGWSSFMLGGVVVVALINLGAFGWLRQRKFIFYATYLLLASFGASTLHGFNAWLLWPDFPGINDRIPLAVNIATALCRLQVITLFLEIDERAPGLRRWNQAVGLLLVLGTILAAVVGARQLPALSLSLVWAAGILYGFLLSILGVVKSYRFAIPLLVSLLIPSLAAFAQVWVVNTGLHHGIGYALVAQAGVFVHALLFVSLVFVAQILREMHLREKAEHDALTGLPGINQLRDRFQQARALAARSQQKVALVFVDADGFKPVNDTFGHACGDQVLKEMGHRIARALRASDAACRLGGDEFIVLLGGVSDIAGAKRLADRLLASIDRPYAVADTTVRLSASIGVAACPDHGEEFDDLLQLADQAMYRVKHAGKNAVRVHEKDAAPTTHRKVPATGHHA